MKNKIGNRIVVEMWFKCQLSNTRACDLMFTCLHMWQGLTYFR